MPGLTVDHVLNLGARQLTDRVRDSDVGSASGGLLGSGNLKDTVDVDLEDNLESGLTSLHRRNGGQSELSKGGVVSAVGTLTLVNGELHGLLVVDNSGESALLDGRNGLTAGNNGGEDVTLHSDTQRERNDIKEQEVRSVSRSSLARQNTGLDGSTVGDGLVGVDALCNTVSTLFAELEN